MENGSISICVFWNQTLDEGYGMWSEEGCRLVREDRDTAICSCDHLTSFGLLVVCVAWKQQKFVFWDLSLATVVFFQNTSSSPEESSPDESSRDDRDIGTSVFSGCITSAVLMLLTIMIYIYTKYVCLYIYFSFYLCFPCIFCKLGSVYISFAFIQVPMAHCCWSVPYYRMCSSHSSQPDIYWVL